MAVMVAGWFESDAGAEVFCVDGMNINEAAENFYEAYGADAVGVDREADVDWLFADAPIAVNMEYRFWAAVDRIAAARSGVVA